LDCLVPAGDGSGVSLVRGDGTTGFFYGSYGGYTSETGPFAFMTLAPGSQGNYWCLTGTGGTMEAFDYYGRLHSVTDHDGNVTQYNYYGTASPSAGLLQTIVDPAHHTTTFSYTNRLLTAITDFAGRTTTLVDPSGLLTSISAPNPNNVHISGEATPTTTLDYYSGTGRLWKLIDADQNETDYSYDSTTTALTSVQHPGHPTTTFQALATAPLTGELTPASSCIASYTDQLNHTTTFTLDSFGNPLTVTDALGYTTVYRRDANGQVLEVDQPNATVGDANYGQTLDANGAALGPVTSFSYDSRTGMLSGATNPDGSQRYWDYAAYATPGRNYVVPTETGSGIGALPAGAWPPVHNILSFVYNGLTYIYAPNMSAASAQHIVYSAIGDVPAAYGATGYYVEPNDSCGDWGWYDWAARSGVNSGANHLPSGSCPFGRRA
jgi:YD repeat-containing protein